MSIAAEDSALASGGAPEICKLPIRMRGLTMVMSVVVMGPPGTSVEGIVSTLETHAAPPAQLGKELQKLRI